MSTIESIWVKVVGAGTDVTTSVDCDPSTTNIDNLKKLVKVEFSPKLDHIAAPDLIIKGDDKIPIEEDVYVSSREDGRTKASAFIVEVPVVEGSTHLYFLLILIRIRIINSFFCMNI